MLWRDCPLRSDPLEHKNLPNIKSRGACWPWVLLGVQAMLRVGVRGEHRTSKVEVGTMNFSGSRIKSGIFASLRGSALRSERKRVFRRKTSVSVS